MQSEPRADGDRAGPQSDQYQPESDGLHAKGSCRGPPTRGASVLMEVIAHPGHEMTSRWWGATSGGDAISRRIRRPLTAGHPPRQGVVQDTLPLQGDRLQNAKLMLDRVD